ncbi:hypothetical protein KY330_01805 [Candidatus Woesearchaeota archaeon]|nr:hypothetical protein [Candidatus Woesearchaeota archaeon]
MKKLITILFALLICVSAASAVVTQRVDFIGGSEVPTTIATYNVYNDGRVVLQYSGTTTASAGEIQYATYLPAGVRSYLVYFMKEGYLPYVLENSLYGERSYTDPNLTPEETAILNKDIVFSKAEYCHAPIREFYALNVENLEHPIVINVSAEIGGEVYSAFAYQDVTETSYIPQEEAFIGHFSATTQIILRIYDENNNPIGAPLTMEKDLLAGSTANFVFEWLPEDEGEYTIVAESNVIDNQCNTASRFTEYGEIELTVFTEEDLNNSCFTSLPGLTIENVEGIFGETMRIHGTKKSNYLLGGDATPVSTELTLRIYDEDGDEVHSEIQNIGPNPNALEFQEYSFNWDPIAIGSYVIEVEGVADSPLCDGLMNPVEITRISTEVTAPRDPQPTIDEIPDQYADEGVVPAWQVDLWEYTHDNTPDDQLVYSLQQSNPGIINCYITSNRYVQCAASNGYGTNRLTVFASDGNSSGSATFNVEVAQANTNQDPVVGDIPNVQMDMNTIDKSIDLDQYGSDPDGDNITWTYSGNNNIAVYINNENVVSLAPDLGWYGTEVIHFVATDEHGRSASDSVTVEVRDTNGDNHAPVVTDIPNRQIFENGSDSTIDLDNYVSDPDGESVTWTFSGNTNINVTISNDNVITFTPNPGWTGQETITFTATDPHGANASDNVVVSVIKKEQPQPPADLDEDDDFGLKFTRLRVSPYAVPNDALRLSIGLENYGSKDLKGVKIKTTIVELGIRSETGPFTLEDDEEITKNFALEIPEYTEAGEYNLRIDVRDRDGNVHRVRHIPFEII